MASDGVIRVFLVNGESRSLRVDERTDSMDVIRFILRRLHVNMEYSAKLFGLQLKHTYSHDYYWLQPGYTIFELLDQYCTTKPMQEWRFLLRIRVLPKTAQHLMSQDPVAFQYFYDQVLHLYLEDDTVQLDSETSVKLGCLELRRFYKDMPQIALKKKENFSILEREIGLEKFFKRSLLETVTKRKLRNVVVSAFEQFETLSMEACMFQFFNLLAKQYPLDVEQFTNCAIGERQDGQSNDLTCTIFVGPNCDVEYQSESGPRRFLAAFNDIHEISYELEYTTRGKVILELRQNSQSVVIHTAVLVNAIHLATLVNGYCMMYTALPHSRMTGGKRISNASRLSGVYNAVDELRAPLPTPNASGGHLDDYAEVKEHRSSLSQFGASILPKDVVVGERIGEGQFGDVHKGVLFPHTTDEQVVAIKTCKPEASDVERAKFLEEAAIMAKFNHRHIIKLFGVMSHDSTTYIIMELALIGQLRRYLMTEGSHIGYPVLLQYICQLCSAVVYLESKNFVHRDIAARNVLLATPELIKLADFGLSKRLEDTDYYVASKGKLPIKWMAPESINFRKFTGLSDVWMFGVCCWEILMKGVKPFVGVKNDEVINMIEMGQRLPLPPDCPAPLFDLLNQCWQYDPQDRPTFAKLEHMLTAIVEQERSVQDYQPRKTSSGPTRQDPYAVIRQDPYAVIRQDSYAPIRQDPYAPEKPRRDPSSSSIHGRVAQENSVRWSGYTSTVSDEPPPPPPPRVRDTDDVHLRLNERFRGTSDSPNGDIGSPPLEPAPLPPKPPRTDSPGSRDRDRMRPPAERPTPAPIVPYSITTITPSDPAPPLYPTSPTYPPPESRGFNGAIPPPSILRPAASRLSGDHTHERVGYYSIPADPNEGQMGRMLSEDGTFVDKYGANRHISSPSLSNRLSASSLPPPPDPRPAERELDEFDDENDELLKQTTDIVRAVMEMSNKVPISRPADYVELVKNVGKALRELLTKVEIVEKTLPQENQCEINMATKVLSSDVTRLVEAMRDAQKNYQTFLEQEYQKQMLKAGHIIAVNAKQLLDTVNSARRKVLRTTR